MAYGTLNADVIANSNGLTGNAIGPGFKNKIINGDFNIWQRGTSFAAIASGTYTADRWAYGKVGAMVHTVSRSTDVPTVAQAGRLYSYSLLVDCTTVDSSIAAGDVCTMYQVIEGYNWLPLAQKTFTLSFWVKATKTGTYCVGLKNTGTAGVSDRSYVAEYTVSSSDTWEFKTVTVSASPSAGTWDYTNGQGLVINWTLAAGSTWQTTAGSWATGNYVATSNQVNACDNTANNFYLCGVQIESGETATSFDARPFGTELALCQRYYNKTYDIDTAPGTNTNVNRFENACYATGTTADFGVMYRFPVEMRASPTVVAYTATGTSGSFGYASPSTTNSGVITEYNKGTKAVGVYHNTGAASGLTSGEGVILYGHFSVSAEL